MESCRHDLLNYLPEPWSFIVNYQNTYYCRFRFAPVVGENFLKHLFHFYE